MPSLKIVNNWSQEEGLNPALIILCYSTQRSISGNLFRSEHPQFIHDMNMSNKGGNRFATKLDNVVYSLRKTYFLFFFVVGFLRVLRPD